MSAEARRLADYAERSAASSPSRVAVVDPLGLSITYAELNDRAARIAGFLVAQGIQPGDRIGMLLPKGIDAITVMFGALKAGAVYVPADYTGPIERARTILMDCNVRAVFMHPRCAGVVPDDSEWQPLRVTITGDNESPSDKSWNQALSAQPLEHSHRSQPDDLAYILYTSGSTGIPKGVMLTHDNAISFVEWCSSVFEPRSDDRFSSHAPFHFDLSVLDIYLCFKHGSELHIISEDLGKNPKELARFIASRRLTMWYSTPSTLALLAQFGDLSAVDCSSLRVVLFAGEVFAVKHLRQIVGLWPQATFYNLYGPTETNVCTFARIPSLIPPDRETPYPIGFVCSHCEGVLLDEERHVVAEGEEGLVYIAGRSLFPGYWNRPDVNAAIFIERDGKRWYNTGDVARFDPADGYVYLGRRDRMVKRRGYRIELGEIERGLYQHPQIREAAVVASSDPEAGVKITAFITVRGSARPSIIELKSFCGKQLLSYMNPDAFQFVDGLPMTSTNKVDYQSLVRRTQSH